MMPTRYPARATRTARLAVVLDFPVPPRKECVEIIFDKISDPYFVAKRVVELGCFASFGQHYSLRCLRKS